MSGQFAPTPMHGAAYAVAIETVGGAHVIGACDTTERYQELRGKLDALQAWAKSQAPAVRKAYDWGIEKVDKDLQARLKIHENSRQVREALSKLPRPKA